MDDKVSTMDLAIESQEQIETVDSASTTLDRPTLDLIVELICRDARRDSLQFALRSDVGLDGE